MGAGKTTVGRALARKLRWSFVDSDHEIERRTGVTVATIFEIEGEAGFRRRESQVIADLGARTDTVIATGGGAVLADTNRQAMREAGLVVYLRVSPRLLYERTRHDRGRPLLQVADPMTRLTELLEQREPLYRDAAHVIVDGDVLNAQQIVLLIERDLFPACQKSS